jgi:large subunit ribosomal protein L10
VNRTQKGEHVEELHARFQATSLAVTTEYRGLTVEQMNALRRELKTVNARYQVTKNKLARRALKDSPLANLDELLRGPIGLVTTADDPVAVAKILVRFAEHHDKLRITGGVLDGAAMLATGVSDLAKLPSREALLGHVLALIQAPATQLLRTIQEPGARMARLLGALERSKQEQEGAGSPSA